MIPAQFCLLPPAIEPAEVTWQDGWDEAHRVFLTHNDLEARFRKLQAGESFVIAEAGFGCGLTFLAAWQLWRRCCPPPGAVLHFVSVERYPLTLEDVARTHQSWPELSELTEALLTQYPPMTRGLHRRLLDDGQVRLSVFFGDAVDGWNSMKFTADAWFLDGFSSKTNPPLWTDEVVAAVAHHSKPGTTLATFTAAGEVRRALQVAGFTMIKPPGFAAKRNTLTGYFAPTDHPDCPQTAPPRPPPRALTIVGAGITGCLLANNLAQRGVKVTVVDAASGPAHGASGNTQGALYVKLGVDYNTETSLALSALLFSQAYYRPLENHLWFPTGVLQLAQGEQEQQRQARFLARNNYPHEVVRAVDTKQARALSASDVACGGLWFSASGWLKPAELCHHLLVHPNIETRWNSQVLTLSQQQGQWHLTLPSTTDDRSIISDHVILCGGHQTPALMPIPDSYRMKAIRGQITQIASDRIKSPKAVICGHRYVNPAHSGSCLTGATFDLKDTDPDVREQSHIENLTALEAMIGDVWQQDRPQTQELTGRVGFRCTTHDYQPIAGELTDEHGALTGLTLFTGLGSKGLTFAPLLAEWLADRLTGQPEALSKALQERMRPERCRTPPILKT